MQKFNFLVVIVFAWLQVSTVTRTTQAEIIVDFEDLTLSPNSFYNGNTGESNSDGWSSGNTFFNNSFTIAPTFTFWSGWSYSNVVNNSTSGFGNQYASFTGGGASLTGQPVPGTNYAIGNGNRSFFNLPTLNRAQSIMVTNTTYAARSMLDGDQFAKQFGGVTGDDPDFFSVSFTGFDQLDRAGNMTGSVTFFLADYRFTDNSLDYVVDDWIGVDLSGLGGARSVDISFDGSDKGAFGLNTPAYLAIDNLRLTAIPEPGTWLLLSIAAIGIGYRSLRVANVLVFRFEERR